MFHVKHPATLTIPLADDTALTLANACCGDVLPTHDQSLRLATHPRFGQLYTLDGDAMASTADEFIIHESLAHLAALNHPAPRRAIVLGGGDGGSARELLKHPSLAQITVAELDPQVVATIRAEMPSLPAGAFEDPRVRLRIGDAATHLRKARACGERFDLILFDLTASDDPACAHLHDHAFLRDCAAALQPGGLVHLQLGSPFYQPDAVRALHRRVRDVFPHLTPALIHVPLYGGPWLLVRASLEPHPCDLETLAARLAERRIDGLRYYNPALHIASAALPNYLRDLLA